VERGGLGDLNAMAGKKTVDVLTPGKEQAVVAIIIDFQFCMVRRRGRCNTRDTSTKQWLKPK
jgi:hypothetical protein